MVAFAASVIATVVCVALTMLYARRRPVGTPLTWGEAMVAAVWVFLIFFLIYGIVPHQWLTYAGNQLGWRTDKFLVGYHHVLADWLPFSITYAAVQDVIAAGIYVVGATINVKLWAAWQNRGKTKPKALPTSAYGRPLIKPAPVGEGA